MEGMSWTLFFEVSDFGIRVLDVQPWLIATNSDTTSKRVAQQRRQPVRSDASALDDVSGAMSPARA